jgi:predicted HicB family RNase H-like nuclease
MLEKPPTKGGKGVKNINVAVPEDLHRLFKMQASAEGITLKEFIVRSASAALPKKGGEKK